jgi:hypothetical protein
MIQALDDAEALPGRSHNQALIELLGMLLLTLAAADVAADAAAADVACMRFFSSLRCRLCA